MVNARTFTHAALVLALAACSTGSDEVRDTEAAGPPTAAHADDKSDSSELRVRAGNMTVWVDRAVQIRLVGGEPHAIIKGRASRNLDTAFAFVPDDAFGEAAIVSARSFEVTLRGGHEINSIFSGLPLLVSLGAPSDPQTHYTVQLAVRPAFSKFAGTAPLFVSATTRPIFIGRAEADPLRYATRVKGSTTTPFTVLGAGAPTLVPAADGFDVHMSYSDLEAAWLGGGTVTFQLPGGAQKRAVLGARLSGLALTTQDPYEVWPPVTCRAETYACTLEHQGVELATCGDYREVSHCAYADICEITNEAPLQLSPIDLGFAWDAQLTQYRAGCTGGYDWCSLDSIETFTLPECLAEAPTLEQVVAHVAAETDDPGFEAGPYTSGDVLDRAATQATPYFSSSYSAGGPALFDAIDGHMGGGEIRAWTVLEPVPCHNCTSFRSKLFVWWPAAFRVVAIEGRHGYDS
ncbi:MAG: hypothetical protein M3680_27385 [Myxococcota bacterium]|nr:hypothetical protein [Myxococcota bacterium]